MRSSPGDMARASQWSCPVCPCHAMRCSLCTVYALPSPATPFACGQSLKPVLHVCVGASARFGCVLVRVAVETAQECSIWYCLHVTITWSPPL